MSKEEKDDFGDRMKKYEMIEAGRMLIPLLPVMVRLDGRSFHTLTKGMDRPYDEKFRKCMTETTKYLVEESNALIGYTQSDEISLVLYSDQISSQILFDGRIQKLTSILSSMASAKFNSLFQELFPAKKHMLPIFDCRVWNVPNKTEAACGILWREIDCTKNSLSMAAHAYFPYKQLHGKSGAEKQEMLFSEKGINWNNYPAFFKRGTYVRRVVIEKVFSSEDIEKLPPNHAARKNSNLVYVRSKVDEIEMPIFSTVINREAVIFDREIPICKTQDEVKADE